MNGSASTPVSSAPPHAGLAARLQLPRFHALGEPFFSLVPPQPLQSPRLVCVSPAAAALLGVSPQDEHLLALCNGSLPAARPLSPLSMVYSGHQFGSYNLRLGDGRAILLGEVEQAGQRYELQLKGAGPTPYSRQGDGRAVLRSSIREFLCSEAMHGLGIPTTRALAVMGSEHAVYREQVEPAATVLRLSPSHVRFGSFEYFSHTRQHEALKVLADFVIAHHYPECLSAAHPYEAFFLQVVTRTARLIAHWQAVGFAHGVLNTDNMSILGETFDYGPFGFLDDYNPGFICNHSDYSGRYAFDQQPAIGLWNCNALAHALLPLVPVESLREVLQHYQPAVEAHYLQLMCAKLGLQTQQAGDDALLSQLLVLMKQSAVDYTRFFRQLCDFSTTGDFPATGNFSSTSAVAPASASAVLRDVFVDREAFDAWCTRYTARLQAEASVDSERRQRMQQVNPKFILRNYLAQIAIDRAQQHQDYSEVQRLLTVLLRPFDEHPACEHYAALPPDWGKRLEISCSS